MNSIAEGRLAFEKLNSVVTQFLNGELTFLGMMPQDQQMENAVRNQKIISLIKPNAASSKAISRVRLWKERMFHEEKYFVD